MPTGVYQRTTKPSKFIKRKNKTFIILSGAKNKTAVIDTEDFEKVCKSRWFVSMNKYVAGSSNVNKMLLHHVILGKPQKGFEIDHINENTYDNRKSNLRLVNRSINNLNRKGTAGVWFRKDTKKWSAEIKVRGKKICLGCYKTYKEAKEVRDNAKNKFIKAELEALNNNKFNK